MTVKNMWAGVVVTQLTAVFALSAFAISAHAFTPGKPAPGAIVYIAALGSLGALLMVLFNYRRQGTRRNEEQSLRAANLQRNRQPDRDPITNQQRGIEQ